MSVKTAYNSFWNYTTTISVLVGCGIVYYAIWLVHFGTSYQVAHNALAHWIAGLSGWGQLLVFVATPFVAAALGGVIIGIIVVLLLDELLKYIIGKH